MKKLLPVLLLGSIALAACAAPYPDDYYDDYYYDRYERDYDRYDDYIEHQIYSDPSFEQKRAQVMRILERRSYRVHEIEADDRRGRPVLKAEAFRNGREYDFVFSWPDLRIISERIDY